VVSLAGFIAAQRAEHAIPYASSCRAVGVSQAWFYKWVHGDVSLRRARREALAAQIRYLFTKHKRRYGSPRITADLQALGWRVSKNTVAMLMRELGLVARPKRRRGTTKADRSARKAPDLVGRDFSLRDTPNRVWVGDLTNIPNEEGPLYLGSVLDLHSRRVVGFGMDAHHDAELARARCAWRSRSAAGKSPEWSSTPTRAGVHRAAVRHRVHACRGDPVDGAHRVGFGQRGRGELPFHPGV
jgi:putative transposase